MTDPSQSVSSYYYRDNLNLNLLGLLAGEIVCPKKGFPFFGHTISATDKAADPL